MARLATLPETRSLTVGAVPRNDPSHDRAPRVPLGWAATWATRRVLRRYLDAPVELCEGTLLETGPPPMIDAHEGPGPERRPEGP